MLNFHSIDIGAGLAVLCGPLEHERVVCPRGQTPLVGHWTCIASHAPEHVAVVCLYVVCIVVAREESNGASCMMWKLRELKRSAPNWRGKPIDTLVECVELARRRMGRLACYEERTHIAVVRCKERKKCPGRIRNTLQKLQASFWKRKRKKCTNVELLGQRRYKMGQTLPNERVNTNRGSIDQTLRLETKKRCELAW